MDRALGGDLHQPLALVTRQRSSEGQLHFDLVNPSDLGLARYTIVSMDLGVRERDMHGLEWPMPVFCIHPHGDAGASPERGQEELIGARPRISAAGLPRLIRQKPVLADLNFFHIRQPRSMDVNFSTHLCPQGRNPQR